VTTLEGRPNTALLVIDTQNAILAAAADRDGVLANIGGLAGKARDAHTTDDRSAYGGPPAGQVIALTNLYWTCTSAPGRAAEVVPAAEVSLTPPARFTG
jgi:nicotinamidase-related amidase